MSQNGSQVEEVLGGEKGRTQVVTGSDHIRKRKVDLDAILTSQGNHDSHIPRFDVGEKENVPGVDDDDALLDMVAAMPPISQHECQANQSLGDLDDIDALLDLEEADMDGAGCCGDDEEMIMLAEDGYNMRREDPGKPVHVSAEDGDGGLAIDNLDDMIQCLKGPVQDAAEGGLQPGGPTTQQDVAGEENNCLRDIIRDRTTPLPQKDALNATDKYVTVTSMSGERVYAPISTEDDNKSGHLTRALRQNKGCLLATKIDDLLASVEKDHFERVLRETKGPKRKRRKDSVSKKEPSQNHVTGAQKSGLWVDKYAPKTFMELLSDDMTNKDVVKWLMEWAHCVFGKAKTDSSNMDPYGRPEQKIILLAGPPGLGKTTLAHVVARHCGYKALEINASDERNGPALLSRVVNAMEMTSVIGENRPNCIIIDEIDGASAGGESRSAISALIKLAKAMPSNIKGKEGKPNEDNVDGMVQATKKRGKNGDKPLTRPIICICNDLYAHVLRPLREVAKVCVLRPPGAERLVERLQNICKSEKLKAEKSTLRALVDKTECDIRSCLNTMQFIAKKKRHLRLSDIASVGTGQKDVTVGAFRLWKDMLHLKRGPVVIGRDVETESQRSLRLYSSLADFGDQDLVLGGLYESLPSIILFDMALIRTSLVLENMEISDIIQTKLSKSAQFSLMKYLPATTLRVAGILAGPENPSVRWPRALPASIRDAREKKLTLGSWMRSMKPESYTSLGKTPALLDVIPFLPWILTPNLRPVSRHLYSSVEKKSVSRLVDAMLALGISYAMEDSEDETKEAIQLVPPLHAFWDFPSGSYHSQIPAEIKPKHMPVQTRQMVVHELDMERIKQGASHRVNGDQNLSQTAPRVQEHASTTAVPITLAQRLEENRVNSKTAKISTRKRNWFDDVKDKEAHRNANKSTGQDKKFKAEDMPVLYKFHEGYTNAVKKPVKIGEL